MTSFLFPILFIHNFKQPSILCLPILQFYDIFHSSFCILIPKQTLPSPDVYQCILLVLIEVILFFSAQHALS